MAVPSHTSLWALLILLLVSACRATEVPADLVWIEGRVLLPAGLPDGEEVAVQALGRKFAGEGRPRALVDSAGHFRIGIPAGGLRVRLDVVADHLYLKRPLWVHLRRPPETVELRPTLAAEVIVELIPNPEHAADWSAGRVTLLTDEGLPTITVPGHFREDRTLNGELHITFPGVPDADAHLVEAIPDDGFDSARHTFEAPPGETVTVELDLRDALRVTGRVEDEEGAAIPCVEAYFQTEVRSGRSSSISTHTTWVDEEGCFEILAFPWDGLDLTVSSDDHLNQRIRLPASGGESHVTVPPLVLERGNSVKVELSWPDGAPVDRAQVILEGPEGWEPHTWDTFWKRGHRPVDGGRCVYAGLGEGPFYVEAIVGPGEDGLHYGCAEDVLPGATVEIVLQQATPVEVQVVDEQGEPIASCRLHVRSPRVEFPLFGLNERVEDPRGVFTLDLPPGRWRLDVVEGGFGSQVLEIPASEPLRIVAQRSVICSGVVVTSSGEPVEGATVRARHEAIVRGSRREHTSTTSSAPDGSWSLELPPGAVRLSASPPFARRPGGSGRFGRRQRKTADDDIRETYEAGEVVEGIVLVVR